jgi:outer membrane protein TolC
MVTFSLPLFKSRYSSRTRQNELRQLELESLKSQKRTVLETSLAEATSGRNSARIQYETQQQNLEKARDAEQILLKQYETGTIAFDDLLDLQEMELKFQMDQIQAVQMYYEQSAIINYLVNR